MMETETKRRTGKVVTFYSYVGRVGQSMALANVATLLTRWGYRTLMVDWNLQEPGGIEKLFPKYTSSRNPAENEGVLDLLRSFTPPRSEGQAGEGPGGAPRQDPAGEEVPPELAWEKYLVPINLGAGDSLQSGGTLELLGAGRRDPGSDYVKNLYHFDVDDFYAAGGDDYIERLRRDWKAAYDFVLVDCQSGITPFGSICTIYLPDILVLLFPTSEHGYGATMKVARHVTKARRRLPFDRLDLLTIPVPAMFDQSSETYEKQEEWLGRFEREGAEFHKNWLTKDCPGRDILNDMLIPYEARLSMEEALTSLRRQVPARKGAAKAYESLAALLANDLQESKRLHTHREVYVTQAWKNLTLPVIQNLHAEWLRTNRESGKRANLDGGKYPGEKLVRAHLSEASFVGADLSSANLVGADIAKADLSEAILERADLKDVKGAGADLKKATLTKAVLESAQFPGANFRGAELSEASLIKANLEGANFHEAILDKAKMEDAKLYRANLKEASLKGATGLTAGQFMGVNLTNTKLPEPLRSLDWLREKQKPSYAARFIFGLLALSCVYASVVAFFQADDVLLLTNGRLGALAGWVPAVWFFLAAPLVLFLIYVWFLMRTQRLWDALVGLPATLPDGRTLNEAASDWFVAAAAYPYFPGRAGAARKWLRRGLGLLTHLMVLLTQGLFLWKLLPLREWPFIIFHILLVAVTLGFGLSYRRKGVETLKTNNTGGHWKEAEHAEVPASLKLAA